MATMRCFLRNYSLSIQPLPPIALPSKKEIHFWYIFPDEVRNESLLNHYMELLSSDERDKVLRIQGDKHRKNALLARALVRTTIARYQINQHRDPRSIKFRKNFHGKPELEWNDVDDCAGHTRLYFNISHTCSLIACGISATSPIGVDVERKERKMKNSVLAFAERFFTQKEVEHLKSILDSDVQRHEFIKLWTLKEAYVKAMGKGFSAIPFNTFSICFEQANLALASSSELLAQPEIMLDLPLETSTTNCQFALLDVSGCHYAAICSERDTISHGSMELAAWKTIPFVNDERASEHNQIMPISGSVKLL